MAGLYTASTFAAFLFVCAISASSALSWLCNNSVCHSRRAILSESDNGSAAAGLKATIQAPTRAPAVKLCLARTVTSTERKEPLQIGGPRCELIGFN